MIGGGISKRVMGRCHESVSWVKVSIIGQCHGSVSWFGVSIGVGVMARGQCQELVFLVGVIGQSQGLGSMSGVSIIGQCHGSVSWFGVSIMGRCHGSEKIKNIVGHTSK